MCNIVVWLIIQLKNVLQLGLSLSNFFKLLELLISVKPGRGFARGSARMELVLHYNSPVLHQKLTRCHIPLGGIGHSGGDEAEDNTFILCFFMFKIP